MDELTMYRLKDAKTCIQSALGYLGKNYIQECQEKLKEANDLLEKVKQSDVKEVG